MNNFFRKFLEGSSVIQLDRIVKARMIEAVLTHFLHIPVEQFNILDIGCGNGDISGYFSQNNKQFGVDIFDKRRKDNPRFYFIKANSEKLPFIDDYFDIVISNHVIEHVKYQSSHLSEINRVLNESGIVYLATPNKNSPIMKGHFDNNLVLKFRDMKPLFIKNGFTPHEYSMKVIKEPAKFNAEIRSFRIIPRFLLERLRPIFPSHIFILTPNKR